MGKSHTLQSGSQFNCVLIFLLFFNWSVHQQKEEQPTTTEEQETTEEEADQ
jgi:hypothetical protein